MVANEGGVSREQHKSGENSSPGSLAAVVLFDHCLTHTEAAQVRVGRQMRNQTSLRI